MQGQNARGNRSDRVVIRYFVLGFVLDGGGKQQETTGIEESRQIIDIILWLAGRSRIKRIKSQLLCQLSYAPEFNILALNSRPHTPQLSPLNDFTKPRRIPLSF